MSVRTVTVFETRVRSPRALRDAMRYRRHSLTTLAQEATRELRRQKERGVHRSTLGHLLTGYQKTVRPEVARTIEEILDVPAGSLFETRVSNLSRETARADRGSVAPMLGAALMLAFGAMFVVAIYLGLGWFQAEAAHLGDVAGQFIGGVL